MGAALDMLYGQNVPMSAASWVALLRERNDLTQEQFAERVGKDRVTVANWERAKYEPDFSAVRAIIEAFPEASAILAGDVSKRSYSPQNTVDSL